MSHLNQSLKSQKNINDYSGVPILLLLLYLLLSIFYESVPQKKPLEYIFSSVGIIDFIAIIPSFILFGIPNTSPVVKLLRIVRLVRILRLLRVIRLVSFFGERGVNNRVEKSKKLLPFINLEIFFFALFNIVTFSASFIYLFEKDTPNTFFKTIPDGMWWAMSTITTVGYGDIVPITLGGKIIAVITMLAGLALFALLISIVGPALQVFLFGSELEKKDFENQ